MSFNFLQLSLSISVLAFSSSSYAVFCNNGTSEIDDDLNLNVIVSGTSSARSLAGSQLEVEYRAGWASSDAFETPLNLVATLNGSIEDSVTTDPNPNPISQTSLIYNYSSLSTGMYTATATSSDAPGCSAAQSFIVQDEPTATVPSFISRTISPTATSATVSVTLDANYSVDSVNSLNGNSPDITWHVDGQTYNTDPVTVSLPNGEYEATFTVDDGVFSASDSTLITVTDQLKMDRVSVEAVCVNTRNAVLISWEGPSSAENYQIEYKPQFGSWINVGTSTQQSLLYTPPNITQTTDTVRVQACSSSRCGPERYATYINAGCEGPFN